MACTMQAMTMQRKRASSDRAYSAAPDDQLSHQEHRAGTQALDRRATSGVERNAGIRPAPHKTQLSLKQLGLTGVVLFVGIGIAWVSHHWWTVGRFVES